MAQNILPLLTKKNTALCQAMCQKTSLKGSHEKRKYQFHILLILKFKHYGNIYRTSP